MNLTKLICLALVGASLAACSSTRYGGNTYTGRNEVRQVEKITRATIISIDSVQIDEKSSGLGGLVGAAAGGIGAASAIGQGNGSILAGIAGATLGGIAANAIEGELRTHEGLRITVLTENKERIAVTQSADPASKALRVGDAVHLLNANGIIRVARGQ